MAEKSIFVLGVALLTWGGVFLYLLRLAALAKSLEAQLKNLEAREVEIRESEANSVETPPLSLP